MDDEIPSGIDSLEEADDEEEESDSAMEKKPLAELSKEELVQRCKTILLLAQRAKKAKDDALDEVGNLKDRSNEMENRVQNLTEEKVERDNLIRKLQGNFDEELRKKEEENGKLRKKIEDLESRLIKTDEEKIRIGERTAKGMILALNRDYGDLKNSVLSILETEKSEMSRGISELHQRLRNLAANDETESVCTSVSKAEDASRMFGVENSLFEERYGKLKVVALKLKKKVSDLETKDRVSAANFASLQAEFDKLSDVVDEQKETIQALSKELNSMASLKEKLVDTEEELSSTKRLLKFANEELTVQISKSEVANMAKESTERENRDLKAKTDALEKEISALKERESRSESVDLLSMELEASERRISELTSALEDAKRRAEENREDYERERNLKLGSLRQIEDMEYTLKRETERAEDLKGKLVEAKEKIRTLEASLSNSETEVGDFKTRLESKIQENEDLSCQLAEAAKERVREVETLKGNINSLQRMLSVMEEELQRKTGVNEELTKKITSLQNDYDNYRVRAQSVLKKQAKEDEKYNQPSSAFSQEVVILEKMIQTLNEKIEELRTRLSAVELEKLHLQEDHDRLMQRHSTLLQEMAAKEVAARAKQEQLLKLADDAEKSLQEASSKHRLELDVLKQAFEIEIKESEARHNGEVMKLQKQLDDLDNKLIMMQHQQQRTTSSSSIGGDHPSSLVPASSSHLPLEQREAAEGSEEHSSSSPVSSSRSLRTTPMPLDQLLQYSEGEKNNSNRNNEDEIRTLEKKVAHMTALLSETEAENARLSEMTALLKEEIRSYQRSEERIKHIEKLEYVKNVIFKFLTLPGCDEKCHMIPVLSTILKLSPEETKKLHKVVQSQIEEDRGASEEPGGGWSTYLGLWTTP